MTLVNWNNHSGHEFPTLSNLLGNFVGDIDNMIGSDAYHSSPAVNIMESEHGFTVEVAAPGLSRSQFDIKLDGEKLTISAKTQETEGEQDEQPPVYKRKEFNYSAFSRTFRLPSTVDGEKISAKYQNGILKIDLPKKEEVKPRAIQVK